VDSAAEVRPAIGSLQDRGRPTRLTQFAWLYYAYLLFVILFGAWVRISGSGAGCGGSWPTCHGELMPPSVETKTLIEYSHRLTSGTLGLLSVVLVGWVWKAKASRRCKIASLVTLALVVVEALIGAGLVLRELVADDASAARAVVVALHLGNTLILAAAAGLVAFWSAPSVPMPVESSARRERSREVLRWGFLALLVVFMGVSMAGAVTALGDTLFPVAPTSGGGLFAHVRDDLASSAHFLVQLRVLHPVLAVVLVGAILAGLGGSQAQLEGAVDSSWVGRARVLTIGQALVGVSNIALQAPGFMQLLHLLMAHLLWLCLVLITAGIWATR